MSLGVLIVGHGSREAEANRELEALIASYRASHPGLEVVHGYIELAEPGLDAALHQLAGRVDHVVVVPLFLFAAGHVKHDIPQALDRVRRAHPTVRITAAPAFGVHPELIELAFARAAPALDRARDRAKTAVVVVGRGSSDPDANGDFCKVVRLFAEGRGLGWVVPSFIGVTGPSFEDAVELVARARPERVVVVPYFLFAGRLIDRLRAQVAAFQTRTPGIPITLAAHLGGDAAVARLLDQRLRDALDGARPSPCATCQHRAPISGVTDGVGEVRALLGRLRHDLRALVVLTKKVELGHHVAGLDHLSRDLEEMHDLVHEIDPGASA